MRSAMASTFYNDKVWKVPAIHSYYMSDPSVQQIYLCNDAVPSISMKQACIS